MKEKIVIFGIAPCLEEDVENLAKILDLDSCDFMAVGLDAVTRLSGRPIQHMATYHVEELSQFRLIRQKNQENLNYKTHSHKQPKNGEQADYIWPLVARSPFSGSSSLLGCQAAIGLGYKKIILCGCPMQGLNNRMKRPTSYDKFQKGWVKFAPQMFGDKVRSMSGWTREFLGCSTEEWLQV